MPKTAAGKALAKTSATPAKAKLRVKAPAKPSTAWQIWSAKEGAVDELCNHIVSGGRDAHLNAFCKARDLSYTTMLRWLDAEPARAEMYARAREDRADILADEIVSISDDTGGDTYVDPVTGQTKVDHEAVQRSRLRVDARKWAASKLKPRVYGEKLELGGQINTKSITDEALLAELAKLGIVAKIGAPAAAEEDGPSA